MTEVAFFIFIIVVALVSVVGTPVWLTKRWITQRQKEPICGCDHHFSFHTVDEKKNCMYAEVYGGKTVVCVCQQYIGPEPPIEQMLWRELEK